MVFVSSYVLPIVTLAFNTKLVQIAKFKKIQVVTKINTKTSKIVSVSVVNESGECFNVS